MKHEEMLEKLPAVLNRLEGRGAGSKTKVDAADDIETLAAYQEYALQNALLMGELHGKGFKTVGGSEVPYNPTDGIHAQIVASAPKFNPDDQAEAIGYFRDIMNRGVMVPTRVIPPSEVPSEDAGRTVHAEIPRGADVVVPLPDDPRSLVEWLPTALWAAKAIGQLIAKWRKKR